MSWRRVTKAALVLLHGENLAEHGGLAGLRDEGLLDSALGGPLDLLAYADPADPAGPPDMPALAASYAAGLAKNHAFVDGNKSAAFLASGLFLYLNGYRLQASQADATVTVYGLDSGDLTESDFAAWLRAHAAAR